MLCAIYKDIKYSICLLYAHPVDFNQHFNAPTLRAWIYNVIYIVSLFITFRKAMNYNVTMYKLIMECNNILFSYVIYSYNFVYIYVSFQNTTNCNVTKNNFILECNNFLFSYDNFK